jgi:hypothetical protein
VVEPKNLRELLVTICSNYPEARTKPFGKHPLLTLIRKRPKEILSPLISDDNFIIEGSLGKGKWAQVPWIGIFDRHETASAQEGTFLAYLFSEDLSKIYLVMMVGITDLYRKYGKRNAFLKLKSQVLEIQARLKIKSLETQKATLSSRGFSKIYNQAIVLCKEYSSSELPSNPTLEKDLKTFLEIYRQYCAEVNLLTYDTNWSKGKKLSTYKEILKRHYLLERTHPLVNTKKGTTLKKHKKLVCEICGFALPGENNEITSIFEVHCRLPPQRLSTSLNLDDFILVCTNCHHLIHSRYPWLTLKELKKIYYKLRFPQKALF